MNLVKVTFILVMIFSVYVTFAINLPKEVTDLLSSLFSKEFSMAYGSESIGGNAGAGRLAVNAYVDKITGQVIEFSNYPNANLNLTRVIFLFDFRSDKLVNIIVEDPEALSNKAKVIYKIALENYQKFAEARRVAAQAAARAAQATSQAAQQAVQQSGRLARLRAWLAKCGGRFRGGGRIGGGGLPFTLTTIVPGHIEGESERCRALRHRLANLKTYSLHAIITPEEQRELITLQKIYYEECTTGLILMH